MLGERERTKVIVGDLPTSVEAISKCANGENDTASFAVKKFPFLIARCFFVFCRRRVLFFSISLFAFRGGESNARNER